MAKSNPMDSIVEFYNKSPKKGAMRLPIEKLGH